MMKRMIDIDCSRAEAFAGKDEIAGIRGEVLAARESLLQKKGPGNDFLGWLDLPVDYDKEEFSRIKKLAEKIRSDSQVLIVIGIGGSYLGARAAIEFLGQSFHNELRQGPEIYFAGNQLSGRYLKDLVRLIGDRSFSINMISKSGTTTEPGIAFRFFRELLEKKYGPEEAAGRIYCTTDRSRGALKKLADARGYETLVVPDDIGGRYSVLTAVGLLPIAVSGADIDALMEGARKERQELMQADFEENPALLYAAFRNVLLRKGKSVEILASYEPALHSIAEWWKQLFGESEGKGQQGLFPASLDLTTDLHSLGQFVQDGSRIMFETVLWVDHSGAEAVIPASDENEDGLEYLSGKEMDHVNEKAMQGTMQAHVSGGVPNLLIHLDTFDEESLGRLFYFFEFACAVSAYTLGVNPFDQPGVEEYKKNMFTLLGKK